MSTVLLLYIWESTEPVQLRFEVHSMKELLDVSPFLENTQIP
jgi:hypothetical protein